MYAILVNPHNYFMEQVSISPFIEGDTGSERLTYYILGKSPRCDMNPCASDPGVHPVKPYAFLQFVTLHILLCKQG